MSNWNLNKLYLGLDDPNFSKDTVLLDELIKKFTVYTENLTIDDPKTKLVELIKLQEEINMVAGRLMSFLSLTLAVDSRNLEFNNMMVKIQQKFVQITIPDTLFEKYVASIDNLDEIIESDSLLKEYEFMLKEIKESSIHLLSEQEEELAAQLNQSGGSLFSKLQNDLTSTVEVEYDGTIINLAKVRNLAYEGNPEVRKNAYEAELATYKKIDKATAFALNGVKKHVVTMAKKRKYSSPLEETLKQCRINKDVLDALIKAMTDSLPDFRKYLKRKAEMLNHKNGLPFYDLFAPMGKSDSKYTIDEAKAFIYKNFKTFSDDLADLAKRAFEENWIDWLPRQGKRGGAFCSRIFPLKESRVMTNYDGSIGDISTVAHELGHAYHNSIVFNERILNSSYPMPIAETASILCETIVKKAVLKEATDSVEILGLVEQELQDATQLIVDILSRYLFETEVFERVQNEFLNEETLNKMMIDAQLKTYGDGLDPEFLNSGMWINKSHYYSTGRSFYNFPYAFGLLFSKGIYAKYVEKGASFVNDIRKLLSITGKANLMDVASSIGIDITDPNFWKSSIDVIKEDIELFLELTK